MINRVVVGSLIALTLLGLGIAIGANADGQWGSRHDTVVVDDGGTSAESSGQTIVVSDGHYHGFFFFFPFGLLFFLLVLFLVFSLFKRGRRGPWRYGGGSGWLDDWHRRAHERDMTDAGDTGSV